MKHDIEEITDAVKSMVSEIANSFTQPDDDWNAVLITFDGDNAKVIGFDPAFLENADSKAVWRKAIEVMIKETKAEAIALVASTFAREPPDQDWYPGRDGVHTQDLRIIQEAVMLCVCSTEETHTYSAEIHRNGIDPPTLDDEWKEMMDTTVGPLQTTLVEALYAVKEEEGEGT